MVRITAVVKVKNESHQILECIKSIKNLTDNILIIDDFSDDDTVRICLDQKCKVIKGVVHGGKIDLLDKQGFSLITDGWILRVDADERVTVDLANELIRLTKNTELSGVLFARKNEIFGRIIEHGGWFEATQLRFFRADRWNENWTANMHSQPEVRGKVISLNKYKYFSIHLDYQNLRQFVQRSFHNYAFDEAKDHVSNGVKTSIFKIVYLPLRKLFGKYFIRMGFLDGRHGFVLALLLSIYELLIQLYIWDMNRNENINSNTEL